MVRRSSTPFFRNVPEYDNGDRWVVFWEMRRPDSGQWNQAPEKSPEAATERANHLLRLGFIVYQIMGPDGVFMNEEQIRKQFTPPAPREKKPRLTEDASAFE